MDDGSLLISLYICSLKLSCVFGVSIFNIMFEFQYLFSLFSLFLSFLCHINLIIFLLLTLKIWIYMCMLKESLK